MKKKLIGIFVFGLLIVTTVLPVAGTVNIEYTSGKISIDDTDWWPMYRHDSENTGTTTSIAPNTDHLCWKETISDEIYSSTPIVYNDRLYISTRSLYDDMLEPLKITEKSMFGAPDYTEILDDLFTYKDEYDGGVYCLDADKGTELWNYPVYAPNDPFIFENKVYVTDLNVSTASSSLYCLDAETGDNIWDKPLSAPVLSPTIGADGKIFLGCMDYYTYSSSLICLDFEGNSLWTYSLQPWEIINSAPAYCDGKVYFITLSVYTYQGKLYCLDAEDGQLKWSQPIFFAFGSPVCKGNNVFVVDVDLFGYFISNLNCFDADTGSLICDYSLGVYSLSYGTPAVTQDSVIIFVADTLTSSLWLYKIFLNCTLDWKVPVPATASTFPLCYPVCSANKVIVSPWELSEYPSNIYCMEIENGNMLWSYTLDYGSTVNPSIADERVYIADQIGNIYAFEDALKINKISGGILSAKAEIKNKGTSDLASVSWSIDVVGGIFNMIDKHAEGNISTLLGNTSKTVKAFPVIGLGNVEIEVSVSMPGLTPVSKISNGLVLGLIVIVKS